MDTNQPATPVVPTSPVPQVTPVQTQGSSGKNNKMLLIVVAVLAVLIIIAGGLILFRNTQLLGGTKTPKTIVNAFDDLKKELESTDVGASEADLSSFDKDLNSL